MHSHTGRYTIIFNGEIYNFKPLRTELLNQGYSFHSKTDTEVILALYQHYGIDCLTRLNGMFAFAIWDKEGRTLFLARDRLGKKPLYYYYDGNHFIFASEVKSILKIPSVKKDICNEALYDYFTYQYIPEPKSIFKNIYKLRPAHCLMIDNRGITEKKYWDLSFNKINTDNETVIAEELYNKLAHSVELRMVSDVPIGAFLSGGIDSSGVVALMSQSASKPATTCTIGFDSKKYDEIDYARSVSQSFKTDHHEFTVRDNISDNLRLIASYFDEPFSDPSFVPTYFVSKLTKRKVTVALAGDGGDENFAGYQKYNTDAIENRLRNLFPAIIRHNLFPVLANLFSLVSSQIFKKGSSLLNSLSYDSAYGFFLTNSFFNQNLWDKLINDKLRNDLGDYHPSHVTEQYYRSADTDDHVSKILYTDIKTYLPGDILVKVDRMSMANSLEVRAPILDYEVVEFAASIPSDLKYRKGEKKYILKKAFKDVLSRDILYRKKMGFSVPLSTWLQNELREITSSYLFSKNSGISNFFKPDEIKSIWYNHLNGKNDYSSELWSLLVFELWWRCYIESN
jgi:asparagine synthase (glutamine-hydrolysing)